MDHVELKPYPFPEGVTIPRLMPFQEYPWNGDGYLAAEVLRLKEAHGLNTACETGTCLGSTTMWLAEHFAMTLTVDINEHYLNIAAARFNSTPSLNCIEWTCCDSREVVGSWMGPSEGETSLYWLDAHWGQHCPLLDELTEIAKLKVRPCILIHDFQVPGTDFGFDRFPDSGYPFCLEAIAGHLDKIYGEGGWKHNYPTRVEGAKRGWVSIEPVSPH